LATHNFGVNGTQTLLPSLSSQAMPHGQSLVVLHAVVHIRPGTIAAQVPVAHCSFCVHEAPIGSFPASGIHALTPPTSAQDSPAAHAEQGNRQRFPSTDSTHIPEAQNRSSEHISPGAAPLFRTQIPP